MLNVIFVETPYNRKQTKNMAENMPSKATEEIEGRSGSIPQ
jgi:hypothetical protein